MPLPCPSCAQPLELKLDFLIINPTVQCPHCYAVMKFDLDNEANQKMKRGLREIEEIKKKYEGIAKFSWNISIYNCYAEWLCYLHARLIIYSLTF